MSAESRRHPALESGERIAIIEAKYRELRRLGLPDAIRLTAYLADVAKNKKLKAVVASLSRPREVAGPITARIGGDVEAVVHYVVVNPDGDPDEEVRSALAFIMSDP